MRALSSSFVLGLLFVLVAPLRAAEGGGYLHAGLDGEYFANPDLSGSPSFTRRDVRLDFDWGAPGNTTNPLHAPGGSTSPAFAAVGPTNWSARWTGQLMPRFSETYTFSVDASAGVRVFIRTAGAATWTPLLDAWSTAGVQTVGASLVAATAYDFRVEYRQATGAARLRIRWSSPSTPLETLEATSQSGVNIETYQSDLFADAMKSGRDEWGSPFYDTSAGPAPARDADGWPLGDGTNIVWEGRRTPLNVGSYRLRFEGQAQVNISFGIATFSVSGTTYANTLPPGAGYETATNTTTADVQINGGEILYLNFTQTRREPGEAAGTGVRKVQLMRPTTPGAAQPLAFGTVCHPDLSRALRRFTTLRWIINFDTEQTWNDRLSGHYQNALGVGRRAWEYMIMQANETGKDLYACTPVAADADYLLKVAQMIRYGSDGTTPYTSPQANPAYPPLNPNLRVYLERSNEIWNWSFSQSGVNAQAATAAVLDNTPDGQATNFDGAAPTGSYTRWHALQTARLSDVFRSVFGDAAMGDRVRILLEYQYDDGQGTASSQLQFLDDFFNNARGTSPLPPAQQNPASHYIWGAGGALYFGASNPMGRQTTITIPNADLESAAIAPGTTSANAPGWTFTTTPTAPAGVYRPPATVDAIGAPTGGTPTTTNERRGLRFTVGAQPLYVSALGRWVASASTRPTSVLLVRASDRATLAAVEIDPTGVPAGGYAYAGIGVTVTLNPGATYYLVSEENGTPCLDASATLPAAPDVTINGAVSITPGDPSWDSTTWTFSVVQPGAHGFGPLTLRCTTESMPQLGLVPTPTHGDQAAFLFCGAEMSTTVNFPTAGTYAIAFDCAIDRDNGSNLRLLIDDQEITPDRFGSGLSSSGWGPGAWARDNRALIEYSSAGFTIATPGPHTLRVIGDPLPWLLTGGKIYLDHFSVVAADAIFASGIPGAGEANGQVGIDNYNLQIRSQGRYAQTYGLKVAAYEGGWSLGGDFGSVGIQHWCKYYDPRARQAQHDSIDIYARSGGALYTFGTYDQWWAEDTAHADAYQLALGIDDRNAVLPAEPTNGFRVPADLHPVTATWSRSLGGDAPGARGNFAAWNILAPTRADYVATVTSAAGGGAQLVLDGLPVGAAFPGGTPSNRTLPLTPGLHSIQVRTTSTAAFSTATVSITLPGTLAPPTDLAATDADASVGLQWSAVAGATGYRICWGTIPGQPDNSRDLAAGALTTAVTGLTNNTTYYFSIATLNAIGSGLRSGEVGRTPFADGQPTTLALWQFSGIVGNEPSMPATSSSARALAVPLTRGSGLTPSEWGSSSTFGAYCVSWPGSLAAAKAANQYFTFGLAPSTGLRLSIATLDLHTFLQDIEDVSTYRAGLAYSTDGGTTFTDVALAPPTIRNETYNVDLTGVTTLQNTTASVVFRVYFWGLQVYRTAGLGQVGNPAIRIGGSVAAVLPPLTAWRQANFGTTANSGSAADSADPDGDGVSNLLEYATGTNPSATSAAPATPGTAADHLTLTFTRLRAATDVTYHVESSTNLTTWTEIWSSAGNPYPGGTAPSFQQLVPDPQTISTTPRRFLRLRISTP